MLCWCLLQKRSKKDRHVKGSASQLVRSSSKPFARDSGQTPERGVPIAESPVSEGGEERLTVQDARKSKKGFFNKMKDKLKHGGTRKDAKSPRTGAGRGSGDTADAEGREEEEEEEEEHLSKKELELLRREEEERQRFLEDIGYAEGVVEVEFPPEVRSRVEMKPLHGELTVMCAAMVTLFLVHPLLCSMLAMW